MELKEMAFQRKMSLNELCRIILERSAIDSELLEQEERFYSLVKNMTCIIQATAESTTDELQEIKILLQGIDHRLKYLEQQVYLQGGSL